MEAVANDQGNSTTNPPIPGSRFTLKPLKKLTPEMIARLKERKRQADAARAPVADPESRVSLAMPVIDYAIPAHRAAEMLGISAETMKKWRQRGKGPTFSRYTNGAVRYRISDIVNFFDGCATKK